MYSCDWIMMFDERPNILVVKFPLIGSKDYARKVFVEMVKPNFLDLQSTNELLFLVPLGSLDEIPEDLSIVDNVRDAIYEFQDSFLASKALTALLSHMESSCMFVVKTKATDIKEFLFLFLVMSSKGHHGSMLSDYTSKKLKRTTNCSQLLVSGTSWGSFKPDNSANQIAFATFINITDVIDLEADAIEIDKDTNNLGCDEGRLKDPIDCSDTAVFHLLMRTAIEKFKDIHFYRFGKPVLVFIHGKNTYDDSDEFLVVSSKILEFLGEMDKLVGVYLVNLTTDIRLWKALHPDPEVAHMHLLNNILGSDLKAGQYCDTCSSTRSNEEIARFARKDVQDFGLHMSQETAVRYFVAVKDCLHQNTKHVASLVKVLFKMKCRTLTCAPTNIGVVNVVTRLMSLLKPTLEYDNYGLGEDSEVDSKEASKFDTFGEFYMKNFSKLGNMILHFLKDLCTHLPTLLLREDFIGLSIALEQTFFSILFIGLARAASVFGCAYLVNSYRNLYYFFVHLLEKMHICFKEIEDQLNGENGEHLHLAHFFHLMINSDRKAGVLGDAHQDSKDSFKDSDNMSTIAYDDLGLTVTFKTSGTGFITKEEEYILRFKELHDTVAKVQDYTDEILHKGTGALYNILRLPLLMIWQHDDQECKLIICSIISLRGDVDDMAA